MQPFSERAMAAVVIVGWAAIVIVTGYLLFLYAGGEVLIRIEI
jgi:hypothetical protein